MANEIIDKLYVIVKEAKSGGYDNAIKFADSIAKRKLEEFSYIRNNKAQFCEWQTVREYISFAKDIKAISESLEIVDGTSHRSLVGFKSWIGVILLEYIEENGFSLDILQKTATGLLGKKKLPTTEFLYNEIDPKVSEKHFKWSLTVLQTVKPLALNVCRKWIWVPENTLDF